MGMVSSTDLFIQKQELVKIFLDTKSDIPFPNFTFLHIFPAREWVWLSKHNILAIFLVKGGWKGPPDTREDPHKLLCICAKSQRWYKTVLYFPCPFKPIEVRSNLSFFCLTLFFFYIKLSSWIFFLTFFFTPRFFSSFFWLWFMLSQFSASCYPLTELWEWGLWTLGTQVYMTL